MGDTFGTVQFISYLKAPCMENPKPPWRLNGDSSLKKVYFTVSDIITVS
jgi:hypothetical protein